MPLTHAAEWSIQNLSIQFTVQSLNPKPAGTFTGLQASLMLNHSSYAKPTYLGQTKQTRQNSAQ